MTAAITATPRHVVPPSVYRRRRAVAGCLSAAVVAVTSVLVVDVLAGSGGVPASAVSGQPALGRSTTIARPGDTLWSIAEEFRGATSISVYVDALISLNGGPAIRAGERIVLP